MNSNKFALQVFYEMFLKTPKKVIYNTEMFL